MTAPPGKATAMTCYDVSATTDDEMRRANCLMFAGRLAFGRSLMTSRKNTSDGIAVRLRRCSATGVTG